MTTAERLWLDARIDATEAQARLAEASAEVNAEAGRHRQAAADRCEAARLWQKADRR